MMTIIDVSWGITLLVGAAMLLMLGLTFMFLTRSLGTPSISVRCPMTGHMIVVQHITDDSSYLTDVVTCSAFPHTQPITCGLPCLTGGIRTRVSGPESRDFLARTGARSVVTPFVVEDVRRVVWEAFQPQ